MDSFSWLLAKFRRLIAPPEPESELPKERLARMRFVVVAANPEQQKTLEQSAFALNSEKNLRWELERSVEHFGGRFVLDDVELRRGSVEVIVLIGGALGVVAQYGDLVESLQLLHRHIRGTIRLFFANQLGAGVLVDGSWDPSEALRRRTQSRFLNTAAAIVVLLLVLALGFLLTDKTRTEQKVVGYVLLVPTGSVSAALMPVAWWNEEAGFGTWLECQKYRQVARTEAESAYRKEAALLRTGLKGDERHMLEQRIDDLARTRDGLYRSQCHSRRE